MSFMKNFSTRLTILFFYLLIILAFIYLIFSSKIDFKELTTHWVNCNTDFKCASEVAGFNFPLNLSNYSIRASKNAIEITYPLDEYRDVIIRKSLKNYHNNYGINKLMILNESVLVAVAIKNDKIYAALLGAESGYFTIRCKNGMNNEELEGVYKIIAESEAPKLED